MTMDPGSVGRWLGALLVVAACQAGSGADLPATGRAPALSVAEGRLGSLSASQEAKLVASAGADFDLLGLSVAVSGDTALVGASRDDEHGSDAGAAYVFVRSGGSWVRQAKLVAPDGQSNDHFGASVALSGDTALIGATADDDVASDAGAAYVFVRTGATWTLQAKLTAVDGSSADQLGISAALDGDTAVVGTVDDDDLGDRSGAAYVFARSGTAWTQQAKLTAADGAERDQFGISVAVSGGTAVVGAYGDDDLGGSSGAAFVFVRSGGSWSQQAKLLPADGAAGDQFGVAVAISGDTALVGANLDDIDGASDAGSAYVFVRSGGAWSEQAKLVPADGAGGDSFGAAVALVGDTAVIGAPDDGDRGAASGSAYLYARSAASWSLAAKLLASDGESVDFFGSAVALSGASALIGAPGDDDLASSSGAAYAFQLAAGDSGAACASNADCGSGFCTDGVCCDTACGAGEANRCQACSVAAGAAVDGVCAPRAAGTVCRAAAGACDAAETCSGSSPACPADGVSPAGTVCRAAAGSCDLTEACSGSSPACPDNEHRPNLSLCTGGLLGLPGVCLAGICVL
ncbi:MAG TPA: hypothetical protein VFK02_36405 [Kofleriaceae bacterium]|nr:hypothetical protein [Kofleriaceae bacterium]